MATLIQSKQIEGIVTASVVEGSFTVSGSILGTNITASSISSSGPIYGVRYNDIQGTPNFIGGSGILITHTGNNITITNTGGGGGVSGSAELITSVALLNQYTGSNDIIILGLEQFTASIQSELNSLETRVSALESQTDNTGSDSQTLSIVGDQLTISGGNTITIPSGGGGTSDFTELTNVPSGLVSSSDQILGGTGILSGSHTDISSLNDFTSSTDSRLSNLDTFTESIDSRVTALENKTDNTGSDSQILSINGNEITISGGNTITIPTGSELPIGIISSSQQISDLGFISSSHTDISALNQFTESFNAFSASVHAEILAGTNEQDLSNLVTNVTLGILSGSVDGRLDSLESQTGSYETTGRGILSGSISYTSLSDIPTGLVSSSDQILGGTGILSGSHTDISSLNEFTSSIDVRISSLEAFTSALDSTYVTETELSAFSSSIDDRLSSLETKTDNTGSDSQILSIDGNQITISGGNTITIPTGNGNTSTNISDTPPTSPTEGDLWWNSTDGGLYIYYDGYWVIAIDYLSAVSQSLLSDGLISGSDQLTSSLDSRYALSGSITNTSTDFDGDRIISNTLLGDLYTNAFNAGTTGSVVDFLNAVFFPSSAPIAEFTDQTSKFNTNLATNTTNLVSVSLTDTVDNSPYNLVLSGTNASSFTAVPTNAQSSSWEIRANSNLSAGTYLYDVVVSDSTNAERTYSGRSITIAQADNGTLTPNGTFYIIESATSGVITLTTSGVPGSTAGVSVSYTPNYGTQVATNFNSSNPLISVNSTNGQLSVGSPISGSGNLFGSIISSSISWNDQYGNSDSSSILINVTKNNAPTISSTLNTNTNTNQATSSAQIVRLTVLDAENDSIPNNRLSWLNYNSTYFSASIATPYLYLNAKNTNIPAGTYPYTASLQDTHGFRTNTISGSVTISQAGIGTLSGDTTSYIIESAVSGSSFRDATGYNGGNPSQLTVSYSPNYGSQTVQSFTSSNPAMVINNTGYLTLGINLSGSVTQSGAIISSNITYTDQYGNVGSGSISANVFANNAPQLTFVSASSYNDGNAISGSTAGTLTITDTESNSPFQITLGGISGSIFIVSGSSSPYSIKPTGSLSTGTYPINITAVDNYGKSTTLTNKNIIVDSNSSYGKVYIYTSTRTGGGTLNAGNYLAIQGASTTNSDVPPLVTSYTADTTSPFYLLKGGSIGNSSITVGGGTMTLRNTISGSNLTTIVSQSFDGSNSTETFMILFPSGSDMTGIPKSMTDTLGGSTSGEYVMYAKTAGESSYNVVASTIHSLQLDNAHEGYTKWNVIGRTGTHATTAYEIKLVPSSGSAP
jgi:hypothetical protein